MQQININVALHYLNALLHLLSDLRDTVSLRRENFPASLLFLLLELPSRRDLGRSRAQSRKLRLAGTHEVERGFAGNCQAGGSIMSTGFGEPITPDPSQKRSRTSRRPGREEQRDEEEEDGAEEGQEKINSRGETGGRK